MPDFGLKTEGSEHNWGFGNYIMGSWAENTGGAGTGDYIEVFLDTGGGNVTLKCALYAYVADNDVGAMIANGETEEKVCNDGGTPKFFQFAFLAAPNIANNTKYFILCWGGAANGAYNVESGLGIYKNVVYNGWESPLTGESGTDKQFSNWCSFTAAVAAVGRSQGHIIG